MPVNRRTFLRTVERCWRRSADSRPACRLCGRGPTANGAEQSISCGSDVTNAYTSLLADFTDATGIGIIQTIVPYNQRLDKINTVVLGGADVDVGPNGHGVDGPVRRGQVGWMI